MSSAPTGRCRFCGGVYYLQNLQTHESICSRRPRPLGLARAVKLALEQHPMAAGDKALLVRLVWQIFNGYRTDPPRTKLTDPALILARARSLRKKRRPKSVRKASKARY